MFWGCVDVFNWNTNYIFLILAEFVIYVHLSTVPSGERPRQAERDEVIQVPGRSQSLGSQRLWTSAQTLYRCVTLAHTHTPNTHTQQSKQQYIMALSYALFALSPSGLENGIKELSDVRAVRESLEKSFRMFWMAEEWIKIISLIPLPCAIAFT